MEFVRELPERVTKIETRRGKVVATLESGMMFIVPLGHSVRDNLTGASAGDAGNCLQTMALEILDQIDTAPCEIPFGGAGIDGMKFEAPERDPA